jgi:dipeptidyl aminopeptidase/acylaminoacyl peptidase
MDVRAAIARGAAAIAIALTLASPACASTLPGRNGPIVVATSEEGHAAIDLVSPQGRVRTAFRTSLGDAIFTHPSISPDARRAIWSGAAGSTHSSLESLDLRDGARKGIGTGKISAFGPSFLSDSRIVFSGSYYGGRHSGTFVAGANGGHRHRLFPRQALAVSADGHWFLSTDNRGDFHTLFLLDRHGRKVRRLTDEPAYRYLRCTFSPDGRWIGYERELERPGQAQHRADVFVVRRNGTHRRRLTFGGNSADPVFSPDGHWLAFTRFNNGFGGNLVLLPLAHPQRRKVLTHVRGARFQEPAWVSLPPR